MTEPTVYSSGDYASMKCTSFYAYYGYEIVDINNEWCFTADFNGEHISIPASKLRIRDKFDCQEGLLKGIAWLFQKYKLTI
jgi:hypothetical protein